MKTRETKRDWCSLAKSTTISLTIVLLVVAVLVCGKPKYIQQTRTRTSTNTSFVRCRLSTRFVFVCGVVVVLFTHLGDCFAVYLGAAWFHSRFGSFSRAESRGSFVTTHYTVMLFITRM